MAANEPLNQLETTDANNTPIGTDVIGSSLDDELRSIKANIARSAREESTATASAAATLAVTVLNKIVPVSGSAAGSTTITLPAAATAGAGFRFTAWKTDSTNNVIIDASGAETINGSADYTMATQYEAAQFVTDGTSWIVESTAKRELGTSDLADDSVTNAKLANMAQDTLKGRATAGTGDPEDLTPAQARTLLDVYQQATADGLFVNVSGDTMAGDLSFGDNNKAQFGAANDLEIFHNATDSVINDAGTGSLKLQNTGSTKLEVTTTGIDVTGNVVSDGADLDGAVVINESGADVDLRVESNTTQHALFVQGSDGRVGIGESSPEGNLHIKDGSGSGASPTSTINDLVVDCSSFGGISILTPNTAAGYLAFGDPEDGDQGQIFYDHPTDVMKFRTSSNLRASIGIGLFMNGATGGDKGAGTINATTLYSGRLEVSGTASSETVINEDGNDHDFRVESDTNTHALFVQGSDGKVSIGGSAPTTNEVVIDDGTTYSTAITGGSGFLPQASDAFALVNSTTTGNYTSLHLQNVGSAGNAAGKIALVNLTGGQSKFAFMLRDSAGTDINEKMVIDNLGVTVNPLGDDRDFRVESDTNTHALFVQGSDGYVGINESSPGGVLHISNPSTPGSATSYPVNGDELILEGANNVGMTISGGDAAGARIYMGGNTDTDAAQIAWIGSSTNELQIRADTATDFNTQMSFKQGVQVGAPTGGYKGTGTLNATAVYDDNTLLTDFVLDQAVDGEIDYEFYDSLELGGKAAREWDSRNLDIDYYEAQWRERKALPSFRSKAERFDDEGNEIRDSVGTLIQGLQQELETAMVHIAQLNARIKQLEEK